MSWTNKIPELKTKNDLCGIPLTILHDRPPEPAQKGLYALTVMSLEDSKTYVTYVTLRDLSDIVHKCGGRFEFVPDKNSKWCNVEPIG